MRIRLESAKRIGNKIGLNEEKGFAVAIFLALVIVSATVISYYEWFRPPAEPYSTIYLLDADQKAGNYPEVLIANQNSTFNIYFYVENHFLKSTNFEVQIKITQSLGTFPVDTQPSQTINMGSIKNDGKPVQQTATITQNTQGNYSIIFELWQKNNDGSLTFTQNYCVLKIQVINPI